MKRRTLAVVAVLAPTSAAEARPAWDGAASSTAYCLNGRMADGSWTRAGSVAMNNLALGTRITVSRSPTGERRFTVRDRIGWGTQLDFWLPTCSGAIWWGRRTVAYRIGWPRYRWRARRVRVSAVAITRAH